MSTGTPYPNRGVPKPPPAEKRTAKTLDWMRASVPELPPLLQMLSRHNFEPDISIENPTALPYYNRCLVFTECRVDWHDARPAQRNLLTMTGKQLHAFVDRVGEGGLVAFLRDVAALTDVRITRLDFAIDVFGSFDFDALQRCIETGRAKTHIRTTSRVLSKTDSDLAGDTLYIGSRQSGRMIRVYDKGLETGDKAGMWARIELEAKHPHATALLRNMLEYGIAEAGSRAIADLLVTEVGWFEEAVGADDSLSLSQIPRKQTDFEKWALSSLLPLAVRAIRAGIPGFADALEIEIARAKQNGHSR